MNKKREIWIDAAKGFLIILVVLGHAVGASRHVCTTGWAPLFLEAVHKVIYTFHMPAFFVLAGVTWSAGSRGFVPYFWRKAVRLLTPYFMFGILSILAGAIVGGSSVAGDGYYQTMVCRGHSESLMDLLRGNACSVNSPLWFLPCLFLVEVIYYGIDWLLRGRGCRGVPSLALLVLVLAVSQCPQTVTPRWIYSVPKYLLCLEVGRRFIPLTSLIRASQRCWRILAEFGVAFGVYMVIAVHLPYTIYWHTIWSSLTYTLLGLVGSLLTFLLCQAMPLRFLLLCGTASLGIMVMHKIPLTLLQLKFPGAAHLSGFAVVAFAVVCAAVALALSIVGTRIILRYCPIVLGQAMKSLCALEKPEEDND